MCHTWRACSKVRTSLFLVYPAPLFAPVKKFVHDNVQHNINSYTVVKISYTLQLGRHHHHTRVPWVPLSAWPVRRISLVSWPASALCRATWLSFPGPEHCWSPIPDFPWGNLPWRRCTPRCFCRRRSRAPRCVCSSSARQPIQYSPTEIRPLYCPKVNSINSSGRFQRRVKIFEENRFNRSISNLVV